MKYLFTNIGTTGLWTLFFVLLLASCSEKSELETLDSASLLNFHISTRADVSGDTLANGNDGQFSSLAFYIFNEDGYCEYSELVPVFTPEYISDYMRSIEVSNQTKVIYAIANYNAPENVFSTGISETLTMQQLEDLTVSSTSLTDSNIPMIGKQIIPISSNYVVAEIPMERLFARLDIYLYKNQKLANVDVEIVSVEYKNQVTSSVVAYQSKTMLTPITTEDVTGVLQTGPLLDTIPVTAPNIGSEKVATSFYTYQNISASSTMNDNVAPYLLINVKINNAPYTFKGYIRDNSKISGYSLERNTVYRIIAMVDKPDNDLILEINPLPWHVEASEIGQNVEDSDYSFDIYTANDSASRNGIVHYPYAIGPIGFDRTSYASYSFKLTAPKGTVWTATITNGLEFFLAKDAMPDGKSAVSKGIARDEAYGIKVGATKSWGGNNRKTYLYITVNGRKLKINPLQSDNTRKYPGDNDTDILITQTEYQN